MDELSRQNIKSHYEWRKRIARDLPDLGQRVFSLRSGGWTGYGYQYHMERQYGLLVASVNDYNNAMEPHTPMTEQIRYESFIENLKKAEWSKEHGGASPDAPGAPWHVNNETKIEKAISTIQALAEGIEGSEVEAAVAIRTKLDELSVEQFQTFMDEAFPVFLNEFIAHYVGAQFKDDITMRDIVASKFDRAETGDRSALHAAILVTAYGSATLLDKLNALETTAAMKR